MINLRSHLAWRGAKFGNDPFLKDSELLTEMILHHAIWKDLVFHYVIVMLLMTYFKNQFGYTRGTFLFSTVAATLLITYLNHRYFPQLAISRYLNKPQEAFQACDLRWGGRPCDCPLKEVCPHRRMCEFNRAR